MIQNGQNKTVAFPINMVEKAPNIDYRFGPYDSIADAIDALDSDSLDQLVAGLHFGVKQSDGSIREYIFTKDNATAADVVEVGGQTYTFEPSTDSTEYTDNI